MPLRCYLADVIGTGTLADMWRPATQDIAPGAGWHHCDFRPGDGAGRMLAYRDVTDAEHATLAADPRVTVIPLEDAGGAALNLQTATIGDIPAAKRATLSNRLDAASIPTADFTLTTPLRVAIRRIIRRGLLRQVLGGNDFTEALNTTISSIPLNKRNAISEALTARGFNMSVVQGSDTVRQALQKILAQQTQLRAAGWEG